MQLSNDAGPVVTVDLERIVLANGRAPSPTASNTAGGETRRLSTASDAPCGGGIHVHGDVVVRLTNVVMTNMSAADGGAICATGSAKVQVVRSTLSSLSCPAGAGLLAADDVQVWMDASVGHYAFAATCASPCC